MPTLQLEKSDSPVVCPACGTQQQITVIQVQRLKQDREHLKGFSERLEESYESIPGAKCINAACGLGLEYGISTVTRAFQGSPTVAKG